MNSIDIPARVLKIMRIIENAGFDVYLVGGSIRDYLLKISTIDYDLATSATPTEIKKLFFDRSIDKIMDYGEKHGTISLYRDGYIYEITTFREESSYSDGRRPDTIKFIKTLRSDLSRRDFTINALAADRKGKIIDYFNGIHDFESKIIRAVGNPIDRIQEDSLRILRAVRLATRTGFTIDKETVKAIKNNAYLILSHKISGERILKEVNEIIKSQNGILLLHELKILQIILPEIYDKNVINQIIHAIKLKKPSSNIISWSVIFYFLVRKMSSKERRQKIFNIMKRMPGLGNNNLEYIYLLTKFGVFNEEFILNYSKASIKRWLQRLRNELSKINNFSIINFVHDIFEINEVCSSINLEKDKYTEFTELILEFLHLPTPKLPVNGHDAKILGFKERSIADLLIYWSFKYNRNLKLMKNNFYDIATSLKSSQWISSDIIRIEISENEILNTIEETDAVLNEITLLLRLIKSQDSTAIIGLSIKEFERFNKISENSNALLIIDDSLDEYSDNNAINTLPFNVRDQNYVGLANEALKMLKILNATTIILIFDNNNLKTEISKYIQNNLI